MAPESAAISQAQLSKAVLQLNAKLRRKGSLAAYEIHAARSLHTGANIEIQDSVLREAQLESRKERQPDKASQVEAPQVGDTVTPLSVQPKHSERSMYLVTAASQEQVTAQKIIHPLVDKKSQLMSKEYRANPKHLRIIHRPPPVSSPLDPDPHKPSPPVTHTVGKWNPIRRNQDDSDEEDSDSEEEVVERVLERDGPEDDLGEPDVDGEREEETLENPASSSEDLSDGQLEDMVEDLHNLLFLHGPQPQVQGEGGAVRVEEQENVEDDEIVVDDLPPEYRYLRQLS